MRVEPIVPDVPPAAADRTAESTADFARALDALDAALAGAERAEDRFARGAGTLHAAIYERARADVALAVATSSASRAAQAISSILNMQV
jgi:flagellar hook-basal body complex protein FliE